jgi:adenylate cyclase class 2
MAQNEKEMEMEVKFYLHDLSALAQKLEKEGATLVQSRIFELNLRFDTPDGLLARTSRVLRLRHDVQAVMTFKGPNQPDGGVSVRQEIEFKVSDLTAARHLLEALGYQVNVIYEKYRTTYDLDGVMITLDEMPYGDFAEIEGPDPAVIRSMAEKFGLNWKAGIVDSYLGLFARIKTARGLSMRDLTFGAFKGIAVHREDLGVYPADVES